VGHTSKDGIRVPLPCHGKDFETVEEAADDSQMGEAVVAWMNRDTHSEEALSGEAWLRRLIKFLLMNYLCVETQNGAHCAILHVPIMQRAYQDHHRAIVWDDTIIAH